MAAPRAGLMALRPKRSPQVAATTPWQCVFCQQRQEWPRHFSASTKKRSSNNQDSNAPFGTRLRRALRNTKVQWYPIPVGLGIGFLGFTQLYRSRQRSNAQQVEDELDGHSTNRDGDGNENKPRRRKRIRPTGPWYGSRTSHRRRLYIADLGLQAGSGYVDPTPESCIAALGTIQ